jgi:hypothetical protein
MHKNLLLLLALAMISLITSRSEGADLTVRGMSLGSSFAELKEKLGRGFDIKIPPDDARLNADIQIRIMDGVAPETYTDTYTFVFLQDKAVDIQYRTKFRPEKEPGRSNFISSLTEKYGTPLVKKDPQGDTFRWSYDSLENLMPPSDFYDTWQRPGIQVPTDWRDGCNKTITAKLGYGDDPNLVSYYEIWMWDQKPVADYRAEKAREKEQAAKANRPPL